MLGNRDAKEKLKIEKQKKPNKRLEMKVEEGGRQAANWVAEEEDAGRVGREDRRVNKSQALRGQERKQEGKEMKFKGVK